MSSLTSKVIKEVKVVDRTLKIQFGDGNSINYEDCWLRDHCRCAGCYHEDTFQRAQHLLDIPESKIDSIQHEDTQVTVTWDDKHKSTYSAGFLAQFDPKKWSESRRLKPLLWHGNNVSEKVARVSAEEFLKSVDGSKTVFHSLLDYGVAFIENVDVSVEGTEAVCKALGGVQHTLFGGMWRFTTKAEHADTAYTNLPLAVHNDSTYFTEATGLQVLHCLEHSNGSGGETILVDGFYGATKLRENSPEDYQFLTTFDVEAEYLEEGHHHRFAGPVIRVNNRTKDLVQIRYNVYDRSPMAFASSEECRAYYRSLRNLSRYYQDPSNEWIFKLTPGTVMVFDNFRLLHGRTAFTGNRVLCGSYVARSDWLDKARAHRLIQ